MVDSMEYGRLVVLGYSSYRVATVRHPHVQEPDMDAAIVASTLMHARRRGDTSPYAMCQLWEPIGDQNASYVLQRRQKANGLKIRRFHHVRCRTTRAAKLPKKMDARELMKVVGQVLEEDGKRAEARDVSAMKQQPADNHDNNAFRMFVPMNGSDLHASVTEYEADEDCDLFQIGRMPCRQNDVVIPGPRVGASGTVSRFAARIQCSRTFPYECRLYAGGFDGMRKMATAGHALKFCSLCQHWMKSVEWAHPCVEDTIFDLEADTHSDKPSDNQTAHVFEQTICQASSDKKLAFAHALMDVEDPRHVPIDGLTKNGVRLWLPEDKRWFEVSVNGNLYPIEPRSTPSISLSTLDLVTVDSSRIRHSSFNRPSTGQAINIPAILTDGAIIDLGGVQLQFQLSHLRRKGSGASPAVHVRDGEFQAHIMAKMEQLRVQCPVQLHSLRFSRPVDGEQVDSEHVPHVYPACGHVFGFESRLAKSRKCPLCRTPGLLVPLLFNESSKLKPCVDVASIPECVFNPCGHAISKSLATHYASILMPNGRAICPFCAVHLDVRMPFSRLFLYHDDQDVGESNN